ncbi:transglycosylase SLT domain-containing protein [Occallatibacter savannae]|uniref:lytic transglycosylase domain-containing protein n=1 Tax=Occallatibacter savannae TaxID=1002691 RepID=UPI0013A56D6A|nr:transglycosylase SLT domain-containing protein [Occallatibacter savannae]
MAAAPVEGKRYDAPNAKSTNATASTTSQKKKVSGTAAAKKTSTSSKSASARRSATRARGKKKVVSPAERRRRAARAHKIKLAFVASSELRPMAQQLATLRTPAAYSGVTAYARSHSGEASAAAYLALGHAYILDKRYADAVSSLQQAKRAGDSLEDYDDFLAAKAYHESDQETQAEALLKGFKLKYPDSIFVDEVPELEANVLLDLHDAAGAKRVLDAAASDPAAGRAGYQLAAGLVAQAQNENDEAIRIYKALLLAYPLSTEASIARAKLTNLGAEDTLTNDELRSLGDAYYKAGRYEDAADQYRRLAQKANLDTQARNGFNVAAAACDLKLKKLTENQAQALPDTPDENGARRSYLLMELARNRNDADAQSQIVTRMETSFPQSQWLAEALFSSGNMYLLKKDYAKAAEYYAYLGDHFPTNKNGSAAHWRAGWLNYRLGNYKEAARIFEEQIHKFPGTPETASALYWRARLYESQDHDSAKAAANYRTIVRVYQHFFYAQMARQRLAALGSAGTDTASAPDLEQIKTPETPTLSESFPEDSPHLAKAKLLANAGLNEYMAREIQADPDSGSWSALAEAQIYASYGEAYRALRALKRALPGAASASIESIPLPYWRILFPEPYWSIIKAEAAKNNVDPYLVASLIRQESEFNPSVISYANAWGLMQLLPSVGHSLAKQEGMKNFQTFQLLDPETNIRLGTRYLKQTLDKFGGVPEYALAAYNAGDSRVQDWQAAGPYSGMDEFVESIPFTQTREYVQAILRNIEIYREIDASANTPGKTAAKETSGD